MIGSDRLYVLVILVVICCLLGFIAGELSNVAEAAPKPNPLEAKVRVLERKITAMEARQDAIYRWSNKVDEKLWPRPKKKVK